MCRGRRHGFDPSLTSVGLGALTSEVEVETPFTHCHVLCPDWPVLNIWSTQHAVEMGGSVHLCGFVSGDLF